MKKFVTPHEVIEALGGRVKLAERMGVGRTAVCNWAVKGFPPKTYVALKAALRDELKADAPDILWPTLVPPARARTRARRRA